MIGRPTMVGRIYLAARHRSARSIRGTDIMGSLTPALLTKRFSALRIVASAVWGAPAGPARAQGAVKAVHNDGKVRCDPPPGAKGEQCALIQSVPAEDRANVGLTVIVLKTADQ